MTTEVKELIKYFSNGQLPTGENFSELITSMVHKEEFNDQVGKFKTWTERPEISLGPDDDDWHLYVDDHDGVRLRRGKPDTGQPSATDIQLDGWTSMPGRTGMKIEPDAFARPGREIDPASFNEVAADGGGHTIVEMPSGPCAFEITAATNRKILQIKPGIFSFLRWAFGIPTDQNVILHTVVTATGGDRRPRLDVSADADTRAAKRVLSRALMVLLVLIIGFFMQVDVLSRFLLDDTTYYVPDTYVFQRDFRDLEGLVGVYTNAANRWLMLFSYLPPTVVKGTAIASGVFALFLLRAIVSYIATRRHSLRLKWSKESGSAMNSNRKWALKLRGPAYDSRNPEDEDKIYYSVTKLWN